MLPLPTVADDDQGKNAEHFATAGAALLLDQRTARAEDLATTLAGLAKDAAKRVKTAADICAPSTGRKPPKPSSTAWKRWPAQRRFHNRLTVPS